MRPLVSILIPAYNAEKWISESLQSAISQTWPNKEIIVVDDGSSDKTYEIAQSFASSEVMVFRTANHGSSAARNHAMKLSHGDYIQWLDADDLLSPNKIQCQLEALREEDGKWKLLSSSWAFFNCRTDRARFVPSSLWQDLMPVEWFVRKMSENLHMQTSTWLTSREISDAIGPWDTRLQSDDDGEYFARALLVSNGVRFVPEAKVFYRRTPSLNRVSYIGDADDKKNSMLTSMKLHTQYLRSLEQSERVRTACLTYLQTWLDTFYPERPDIVAELQSLAAELDGHLEEPRLRWQYNWMIPIFGWKASKRAQRILPQLKSAMILQGEKLIYRLQRRFGMH